jgi:hypothetical protein
MLQLLSLSLTTREYLVVYTTLEMERLSLSMKRSESLRFVLLLSLTFLNIFPLFLGPLVGEKAVLSLYRLSLSSIHTEP